MNYKSLVIILFGGVLLILFMLAFVSSMYKDMLQIRLEMEYTMITVINDEMHVKCILSYHNPERKNVPKHFCFPVAYADTFSTPVIKLIWMPNIIEQPSLSEKGEMIEWSGSLGEQQRADIKIEYSQTILRNQVVFPLVSPVFPRVNLERVSYRVVLPYTAKNIRCSYPDDVSIQERDGKVIVYFDKTQFTPDKDLIVEWD
ncbi:MAG TPA: hypothetical protein ENN73_06615 [Firmicutes bacterium]|nr:hypothetical protein [Bacillota bacterium]